MSVSDPSGAFHPEKSQKFIFRRFFWEGWIRKMKVIHFPLCLLVFVSSSIKKEASASLSKKVQIEQRTGRIYQVLFQKSRQVIFHCVEDWYHNHDENDHSDDDSSRNINMGNGTNLEFCLKKVANQTLPICLPLRRKSFANIAWRKWRERWITKPLRCATSKDNMTGYFPGCAEWVSGCKTSASRHDAILKWPLLNFQMESQEKQIPHLSLCPSLPKPCGARLGNRQLHKGFF